MRPRYFLSQLNPKWCFCERLYKLVCFILIKLYFDPIDLYYFAFHNLAEDDLLTSSPACTAATTAAATVTTTATAAVTTTANSATFAPSGQFVHRKIESSGSPP